MKKICLVLEFSNDLHSYLMPPKPEKTLAVSPGPARGNALFCFLKDFKLWLTYFNIEDYLRGTRLTFYRPECNRKSFCRVKSGHSSEK